MTCVACYRKAGGRPLCFDRPSSCPNATVQKSRWISMHRETERDRERGNIYVYYFKYAELFVPPGSSRENLSSSSTWTLLVRASYHTYRAIFFKKKLPTKAGLGTSVSGYMRAYDRFCFLLSCPSEESTMRSLFFSFPFREKRNGVSSAHFAPYLILRDTTQLIRMTKCKPGLFSALRITDA